MLISGPVFADLGRCLQTRDKVFTESVADIIPSSPFLSSQVAFSTHSSISLRREEEPPELFSHCPTQAFAPSVGTLAPKQKSTSRPLRIK